MDNLLSILMRSMKIVLQKVETSNVAFPCIVTKAVQKKISECKKEE